MKAYRVTRPEIPPDGPGTVAIGRRKLSSTEPRQKKGRITSSVRRGGESATKRGVYVPFNVYRITYL